MKEIYKLEQPAGDDQLMVAFVNRDESAQVDVQALLSEVGEDAVARRHEGGDSCRSADCRCARWARRATSCSSQAGST